MSQRNLPLCAWCREYARPGSAIEPTLQGPSGEVIALRWHLDRCAEEDPLHAILADALGAPDGPQSDADTLRAYIAIRDRAAGFGVATLRGVVDVRADFARGSRTLRGPGLAWGRITERLRGPQRPANGRTLPRVATPTPNGPQKGQETLG